MISKRMISRVHTILQAASWAAKGHAIFALPSSRHQLLLEFQPSLVQKERVKKTLQDMIAPQNVAGGIRIDELAERIIADLELKESRSLIDRFEAIREEHFRQVLINTIIASGLTTLWEQDVRTVSHRMGINIRYKGTQKTSKSQRMITPKFVKVEQLVSSIRKLVPTFAIRLERQLELRGALVHANFEELKKVYLSGIKREHHKAIRGNALMFDLATGEETDLGKIEDNEKVDSIDHFGFFVNAASSELISAVQNEFNQAIIQLTKLIEFSAREELQPQWKKLLKGQALTESEKEAAARRLAESRISIHDPNLFIKEVEKIVVGK